VRVCVPRDLLSEAASVVDTIDADGLIDSSVQSLADRGKDDKQNETKRGNLLNIPLAKAIEVEEECDELDNLDDIRGLGEDEHRISALRILLTHL